MGIQAVQHYLTTTWWDWPCGSSLLFWRFPTNESIKAARDGWPVWFHGDEIPRPSHKRAQKVKDKDIAFQLAQKVADNWRKNYVARFGDVHSDVDYFGVSKVTDASGKATDIRVVYNATSSGLNDKVWSLNFWMPMVDTPLSALSFGYWSGDFDLGEMSLKFPSSKIVTTICWSPNGINQVPYG